MVLAIGLVVDRHRVVENIHGIWRKANRRCRAAIAGVRRDRRSRHLHDHHAGAAVYARWLLGGITGELLENSGHAGRPVMCRRDALTLSPMMCFGFL